MGIVCFNPRHSGIRSAKRAATSDEALGRDQLAMGHQLVHSSRPWPIDVLTSDPPPINNTAGHESNKEHVGIEEFLRGPFSGIPFQLLGNMKVFPKIIKESYKHLKNQTDLKPSSTKPLTSHVTRDLLPKILQAAGSSTPSPPQKHQSGQRSTRPSRQLHKGAASRSFCVFLGGFQLGEGSRPAERFEPPWRF